MRSLFGGLLRLFPESVALEDLFTEAVAWLFERRPELCLAWLKHLELLSSQQAARLEEAYVRVRTQRRFDPLEQHEQGSRLDLLMEVRWLPEGNPAAGESVADVVMVESKIGSGEGQDQLRRYAEHLFGMTGFSGRTLLYITRAYDPKDSGEILQGLEAQDVGFKQLRWHEFYRFLQGAEKDAPVEEVMAFMEEQGMARSYRFSTTDLIALSNMPRAFEIFDETLHGEVKAELESFTGNKTRADSTSVYGIRHHDRYTLAGPLHGWDSTVWWATPCAPRMATLRP